MKFGHALVRLLPLIAWLAVAPACAGSMSTDTDIPEWRYTLRPSDTLIGVSARYLAVPADWPKVQKHNQISRPRHLTPGNTLRIPLAWLRHQPAPATVVSVTGQVSVKLPDGAERALLAGEHLVSGALISTSANSSATLRFADNSVMVLQPAARLSLDTVSVYAGGGMVDTQLRLQQGRVEIVANPGRAPGSRLQVITPSAVAAVRGTRFRVSADATVTREETLEGEVGLSAAGEKVGVPEGKGTLAEAGKPPQIPVALLSAPDLMSLPTRVDSLPMQFTLPAQPGAVSWLGQIAEDMQFEKLLLEASSDTPKLSFGDLPDGRYLLRVRAADKQGLQGRDAIHAFELDARPFSPLLTAPGTRVRTALPEWQWSRVVGASSYQIHVARDADFSDPVESEHTADPRLKASRELKPGGYYWRVASVDASGQGPFSAPQRFSYDPLPGAPELSQTAPTFADNALTLALTAPPAGLQYELVLSSDVERKQVVWKGLSLDGKLKATPVEPAAYFLAARLVEADGTAGPYATRVIEAPPSRFRWEFLLLLLPLLAI